MQQRTDEQTDTGTIYAGSQTCSNCGMAKEEWQGNGGEGYQYQGQTYCCQGCAEGGGCTCQ